jgi:hypothetical protein
MVIGMVPDPTRDKIICFELAVLEHGAISFFSKKSLKIIESFPKKSVLFGFRLRKSCPCDSPILFVRLIEIFAP